MATTGRFSWFLIGVIFGVIIFEIFNGIAGFAPIWLRSGVSVVRFLIQFVAWIGLMLAVLATLGARVIRRDEMNYLLIGFGAIIVTLELLSSLPF